MATSTSNPGVVVSTAPAPSDPTADAGLSTTDILLARLIRQERLNGRLLLLMAAKLYEDDPKGVDIEDLAAEFDGDDVAEIETDGP